MIDLYMAVKARRDREARREEFWRQFFIVAIKAGSVITGVVAGWCVAEQIKLLGAILGIAG